jgi:phosphate transport system substrate-binding protein
MYSDKPSKRQTMAFVPPSPVVGRVEICMWIHRLRRAAACAAAVLVASTIFGAACAETIKIGGTGAALGTMRLLADAYTAEHANVTATVLPSLGTTGGIKALLAGEIDIALTLRSLNSTEAAGGARSVEYARTPFVFATAISASAQGITTAELVDIYLGKQTLWPDGAKIRLVIRPTGDNDSEMVRNISPEMRSAERYAEQRKGLLFAVTDTEAADNLERVPGALGPSSLALIASEKRALKALALNGVVPTTAALADGSYPLGKSFYMVVGPRPSSAVQGFVDFVRSPPGREILTRTEHLAP